LLATHTSFPTRRSSDLGGRYNPSTDSWTSTSTTNAPSARDFHTAVWIFSEMIIWGGFDGSNVFDTGGKYNPGTNSWTSTSTTNRSEEHTSELQSPDHLV